MYQYNPILEFTQLLKEGPLGRAVTDNMNKLSNLLAKKALQAKSRKAAIDLAKVSGAVKTGGFKGSTLRNDLAKAIRDEHRVSPARAHNLYGQALNSLKYNKRKINNSLKKSADVIAANLSKLNNASLWNI